LGNNGFFESNSPIFTRHNPLIGILKPIAFTHKVPGHKIYKKRASVCDSPALHQTHTVPVSFRECGACVVAFWLWFSMERDLK
jgi:hypothetical protein